MPSWVWAVIALAAVVVFAIVVWQALARRRTGQLQEQFGPEYDRTVGTAESKREAEAELQAREERRRKLEIRPLPSAARYRYLEAWQGVQSQFVDEPSAAVARAGRADSVGHVGARLPRRGLRAAGRGRLGRPSAGGRELPRRSPARPVERERQRLDRGSASGDATLSRSFRRTSGAGRRRSHRARTAKRPTDRGSRQSAKRREGGAINGRPRAEHPRPR